MKSYYLNPEYTVTKEEHSFIFTSQQQEYLLDILDASSYEFISLSLDEKVFNSKNIPKQFNESFEALIQLGVIHSDSI